MARVHRGRFHVLLAALMVAGFALSAFPPASPQVAQAADRYVMIDLGTNGYPESRANGINNSGQIAVDEVSWDPNGAYGGHAMLYEDGHFTYIGHPHEYDSKAIAINNSGQVLGSSQPIGGTLHTFVYKDGLSTKYYNFGTPTGINDFGSIVGYSDYLYDIYDHFRGFVFHQGQSTLISNPYSLDTIPQAINNSGHVVGYYLVNDSDLRAFLYADEEMVNIPTLGGHSNKAMDINESGQIVGYSLTADGAMHAFIYANGESTDLGTLGGGGSIAHAINNKGQVVGQSQTIDGEWHAFIYENGTMTDLYPHVGKTSAAFNINDYGQVVGVFHPAGGAGHAFLANPAPTGPVYYYGLGDSIASGHGLSAPAKPTGRQKEDECRLSDKSYPNEVATALRTYYLKVIANTQFACSGATAAYKYQEVRKNPNKWLGSQALAVQRDIQTKHIPDDQQVIVSITIGANDFEFADPWTFVQLWGVKVRGVDFDLALKLRDANARGGLYSAIDTLLNAHPNLTVILTELYNPFNAESVFCGLGSSRTVIFDQCLPRAEQAVSLWNQSLHSIANEYGGRVQVTSGLKTAFANHKSPGGKTSAGNASRTGGGCGLAGPGPENTWIQYRNDPDSYSFKIPRAIGIAIDNWYLLPANIIVPWWAQNGNRFSWEYDPDAFHFPTDGWRGDCFHPNIAGSRAIAGFVIDAINGTLHTNISKPNIQQAGSITTSTPLAASPDSPKRAPHGQMFGWPQADIPGRAMATLAGRSTPYPARLT